jgi:hypothetical protein
VQQDAGTGVWIVTLSGNGVGWGDAPTGIGSRFSWRVEGNRLTLESDRIAKRVVFNDWTNRWLIRMTGRLWVMPAMTFEIVDLNDAAVRLKRLDNGLELNWTRISE